MKTEFSWIGGAWPGRLAIMPRPRGGEWLADEVVAWRRACVDVVVSLLTPEEIVELDLGNEATQVRAEGMEFVLFPWPDREVPPSKFRFAELITRLSGMLDDGKTIVVHCRQGIGRAGMVAIALLERSGVEVTAAMSRVSEARGCPVPETAEQQRWMFDFARSPLPNIPS